MTAPTGCDPAVASLEARLEQVELQLRYLLEREGVEQRTALAGHEARIRRLELSAGDSPRDEFTGTAKAPSYQESRSESDGSDHEEGLCWPLTGRHDRNARLGGEVTAAQVQETFSLEESVWDVGILVFLDCIGNGLSMAILCLILLNSVIQVYFCWVVYTYLCEDALSDDALLALLHFRMSVAHDIKYADMIQGMSLASQVCSQDDKLPWAGLQMGLIDDLSTAKDAGQHLCTLAVLCWLLNLIGELDRSLRFGSAMHSLVRSDGGPSLIVSSGQEAEGGEVSIQAISWQRFWWVLLLVVIPRIMICALLTYVGMCFLVGTIAVTDLLLNALALAFILDIDEMLFAAFAPHRIKSFLRTVQPIALPAVRGGRCAFSPNGLSTPAKVLIVSGLLLAVFFHGICPFYARIHQGFDIMCSGETDFVTVLNAATGMVEAAPSFPSSPNNATSSELAVLQLAKPTIEPGSGFDPPEWMLHAAQNTNRTAIFDMSALDLKRVLQEVNVAILDRPAGAERAQALGVELRNLIPSLSVMLRLRKTQSAPMDDLVNELTCADMGISTDNHAMTAALQRAANEGEMQGYRFYQKCQEVAWMCGWRNKSQVRVICPVTCGCGQFLDSPANFFASSNFGCPRTCESDFQAEVWGAQAALCADVAPVRFTEDPALRSYVSQAFDYWMSRAELLTASYSALSLRAGQLGVPRSRLGTAFNSLLNGSFLESNLLGRWEFPLGDRHPRSLAGCQFWTSWEVTMMLGLNFCSPGNFRSLRPYCPVSCGCQRVGGRQCPKACSGYVIPVRQPMEGQSV